MTMHLSNATYFYPNFDGDCNAGLSGSSMEGRWLEACGPVIQHMIREEIAMRFSHFVKNKYKEIQFSGEGQERCIGRNRQHGTIFK